MPQNLALRIHPILAVALACLLWGGNAVASRLARGEVTPMTLVFCRWAIVCVGLLIWRRAEIARAMPTIRARWKSLFWMGACGFTGFTVLFYVAAYYTSGVNMTLVQASIPAFVIVGAALFLRERVGPFQVIGVIVAGLGVAVIASEGDWSRLAQLQFNRGDLMLIGACIFYSAYTLGLRDRPALPPLVFFTVLAFAAFATAAPFFLAEIARGQFYWPSAKGLGIMAFVALGPSLAAQLLFMRGVEGLGPQRAGLMTNLTPIFGALMAVFFLGEAFHPYHAIALALTFAGIALGEIKPVRKTEMR